MYTRAQSTIWKFCSLVFLFVDSYCNINDQRITECGLSNAYNSNPVCFVLWCMLCMLCCTTWCTRETERVSEHCFASGIQMFCLFGFDLNCREKIFVERPSINAQDRDARLLQRNHYFLFSQWMYDCWWRWACTVYHVYTICIYE